VVAEQKAVPYSVGEQEIEEPAAQTKFVRS
jgi:hypothetical protein